MDFDKEQDEPAMEKAGRSAAFQEILDLLTELEMEPHRPKPPEAPPAEAAALPEALGDALPMEAPPADGDEAGGGALTPEEIEELKAKLESMG